MLGQLGQGQDRVIPLAFHVDYFNKPWKDPFSDPLYSRREAQYSVLFDKKHKIGKPDYLYLTPLMMIDGVYPLVGSNKDAPEKSRGAIAAHLREPAEVSLRMTLVGGSDARHKTLSVGVGAVSPRAGGREILIGVATYEDRIATDIKAGELAGKTYLARYVVRKLEVQAATPQRGRAVSLRFPVALDEGWVAENCGLTVFAQDEATGAILQAETLRWPALASKETSKRLEDRGTTKRPASTGP